MRCLVTGADGFMGSHLVEALLKWDQCEHVFAFVHRTPLKWLPSKPDPRMTIIVGDVSRTQSMAKIPHVDVIFHLAAVSSPSRCENNPEMARLTNFQGTINLLNRALEMSPHPLFVFTSSAALYGEPEYVPIDEEHPVEPRDSYTYGKLSAEITIMTYQRDQGIPAVIVRPFNIYGPRQPEEFVVPTIITQCLQGVELRLGDGRLLRNFTYVTDATNMLIRASSFPEAIGQVFNLGSRRVLPISRVAEMAVEITGCGLEPIYDMTKYREGDPTILEVDPTLAERYLKWVPRIDIEVGMAHTVGYYQAELERRKQKVAQEMYGRY
jgi:nucleoside-diphosphate-sugar epimerase